MILAEAKNHLPIGVNKHIKLSIDDINDIKLRYSKGESVMSIHEDYPFVTRSSITYWAFRREDDLKARKLRPVSERKKRTRDYFVDLNKRRFESGLETNSSKRNLKPHYDLTEDVLKKIYELYLNFYTYKDIAKELNVPYKVIKAKLRTKRGMKVAAQRDMETKVKVQYVIANLDKPPKELSDLTGLSLSYVYKTIRLENIKEIKMYNLSELAMMFDPSQTGDHDIQIIKEYLSQSGVPLSDIIPLLRTAEDSKVRDLETYRYIQQTWQGMGYVFGGKGFTKDEIELMKLETAYFIAGTLTPSGMESIKKIFEKHDYTDVVQIFKPFYNYLKRYGIKLNNEPEKKDEWLDTCSFAVDQKNQEEIDKFFEKAVK